MQLQGVPETISNAHKQAGISSYHVKERREAEGVGHDFPAVGRTHPGHKTPLSFPLLAPCA
ncbi:hypothetical protein MBAV_000487 [Candidatus Magnetobacterium bavaricum]|uniref:Uncharacterized protein n=1 Tax=Candidatus Magnetobacterium bavaricum TaxID=29290 RepID=A0A0F3GZI8_9BACT|nr:hypothetical protein MBAV_000487 [Candidatus Magnetobacterium bavaricum]